jgi:hypothetical protein
MRSAFELLTKQKFISLKEFISSLPYQERSLLISFCANLKVFMRIMTIPKFHGKHSRRKLLSTSFSKFLESTLLSNHECWETVTTINKKPTFCQVLSSLNSKRSFSKNVTLGAACLRSYLNF